MDEPQDEEAGGGTLRAHLERAARTGKPGARAKAQAALKPVRYPEEMAYLHGWAMELHVARRFGQFGPEPVTYADMQAWASLTERSPDPLEVRGLLLLTGVMAHPSPKKAEGSASGGRGTPGPGGGRNKARRR